MSKLLAAFAVALALPATAAAKLPSDGGKLIVPNSSIGGVKLGMDGSKAAKTWGPGGTCDQEVGVSCRYDGAPKNGSARLDLTDGKVTTIVLTVGQKANGYPRYKGPITRWKTSKGVHIGTTLQKVAKKYPKAKPDGGGLALRSGRRTTYFSSSLGRVFSITITSTQ